MCLPAGGGRSLVTGVGRRAARGHFSILSLGPVPPAHPPPQAPPPKLLQAKLLQAKPNAAMPLHDTADDDDSTSLVEAVMQVRQVSNTLKSIVRLIAPRPSAAERPIIIRTVSST